MSSMTSCRRAATMAGMHLQIKRRITKNSRYHACFFLYYRKVIARQDGHRGRDVPASQRQHLKNSWSR
eukprot:scaffold310159_cov18-Tisochrysis_lutea.AAC.2